MEEGKIVEVRRFYNQVEMAQDDTGVKEWLDASFKGIGS